MLTGRGGAASGGNHDRQMFEVGDLIQIAHGKALLPRIRLTMSGMNNQAASTVKQSSSCFR